jgi:two-component system OmpR family response regulator
VTDLRTAVIADDDPDTRDLIHMVLTQSGFQVVLASDGRETIDAVREHNPLLTTLDVNMPGMDGFAVAKRLREFSQTYLIMITSLTEEVDIIRGFEAGADDYLVKPFRPRELRARADAMLRRSVSATGAAATPGAVREPGPTPDPPPEPEPESWAASAAREFRESAGGVMLPPEPYVGRRMRPGGDEPALPQQPVRQAIEQPVPPASLQPIGQEPAPPGAVLRFADLAVDTTTSVATLGGRTLDLTQVESEVLVSMLRTGRRVRSKADLVLTIRGHQYVTSHFVNEADKRSVETHIAGLRRKLGDDRETARYIETVRGVGYRMAEG